MVEPTIGDEVFGLNLQRLRNGKGWTQQELADRVGLARASVVNMERGAQAPPWPTLCLLADVFGVSLDVFRDVAALGDGEERHA
jgi:transcriptional regulator with XRE-family HTH domain